MIIFPVDAKISRVLGILRLLNSNDGEMSIASLVDITKANLDTLMPQINAGHFLGVVEVDGEKIRITKLGRAYYKRDKKAREKVRMNLLKFEPFKTALSLAKKGPFTISMLDDELSSRKITLSSYPETDAKLLQLMLIQWALGTRLLNYDNETNLWSMRQ